MTIKKLTEKMVQDAYDKYLEIELDESTEEGKFLLEGDYLKRTPVKRHLTAHEFAYLIGMSKKFCKYWFGFGLRG